MGTFFKSRGIMLIQILIALFVFVNTASAQCAKDWLEHDGMCYGYNNTALSWQDAQAACMAIGGMLAEPRNAVEDFIIKGVAIDHQVDEIWLGASDTDLEQTWVWASDLTEVGHGTFSDWNRNQPDNAHGNEDCLAYSKTYGHWNDKDCIDKNPFVCTVPSSGSIVIG